MLPVVVRVLEQMKRSFKAWCYTLDHTGICVLLVRKLLQAAEGEREPCSGRMILDQKNFFDSSCARQAERVEELYQAGCKMRIVKPTSRAGFSSMHCKTWLVDDEVILTGSLNLTHNALENNKEHLWTMRNSDAVQHLKEDFEELWEDSREVTLDLIQSMKNKDNKRKLKRSASTNIESEAAVVVRSLEGELESAL